LGDNDDPDDEEDNYTGNEGGQVLTYDVRGCLGHAILQCDALSHGLLARLGPAVLKSMAAAAAAASVTSGIAGATQSD
jgi:hypothetical protein